MAANTDIDLVDGVPEPEAVLDPRTKSGAEAARAAELVELWNRQEWIRRRREAPEVAHRAAAEEAAYRRAQALAVIVTPGAEDLAGEVDPDPNQLERQRMVAELYAARVERESREERLKFLQYDHNCDRATAEQWWAFDNGHGPRPSPVIAEPEVDDGYDDMLDEIEYDANGHELVVRRRPGRSATHPSPPAAQLTQASQPAPPPPVSERCSVCRSGNATQIASALASGASQRKVATRFGLTEASLRRHRAHAS
jgi:hypothetical protein